MLAKQELKLVTASQANATYIVKCSCRLSHNVCIALVMNGLKDFLRVGKDKRYTLKGSVVKINAFTVLCFFCTLNVLNIYIFSLPSLSFL